LPTQQASADVGIQWEICDKGKIETEHSQGDFVPKSDKGAVGGVQFLSFTGLDLDA
jgi:hypothetical protein